MDLGSLLILGLVGQPELIVVGKAGQEHCPDLILTQRLVNERVAGRLESAHQLHQEFVTDAQSGQSYVRIVLFNQKQAMLLERLIPVENNDCSDVPLAIATIAEHYFSEVSVPKEALQSDSAPEKQAENQSDRDHATVKKSDQEPRHAAERVEGHEQSNLTRLYGSINVGQGGMPFLELGISYFFVARGFIDFSLKAQLFRTQDEQSDYLIAHLSHSLYLGSGVQLPLHRLLALSVVPQLGIFYERAELKDEQAVSEGVRARVVPSLGIKSDFYFKWTDRFWIGIGGRVHERFGGRRFVIARANDAPLEVLPLPSLDFDAHFLVSYWF